MGGIQFCGWGSIIASAGTKEVDESRGQTTVKVYILNGSSVGSEGGPSGSEGLAWEQCLCSNDARSIRSRVEEGRQLLPQTAPEDPRQ
jgi:hypothetical protein